MPRYGRRELGNRAISITVLNILSIGHVRKSLPGGSEQRQIPKEVLPVRSFTSHCDRISVLATHLDIGEKWCGFGGFEAIWLVAIS